MVGLIKNLKHKYNLQVQYLCCNNASENHAFGQTCKQEGLGVDFKFVEQNGRVEWKFATLFNWVHAMLNFRKLNAYL